MFFLSHEDKTIKVTVTISFINPTIVPPRPKYSFSKTIHLWGQEKYYKNMLQKNKNILLILAITFFFNSNVHALFYKVTHHPLLNSFWNLNTKIKHEDPINSSWEFQFEDMNGSLVFKSKNNEEIASLHQQNYKLKNVTEGHQFLLKEYSLLGIEIHKTNWYKSSPFSSKILSLKLKNEDKNFQLNQLIFEFNKIPGLFILNCPITIEKECAKLIHELQPIK